MKYILLIGDGMADDPLPELQDMTPLQYAKTPGMDALANAGVIGSAVTVPEGVKAGSDTAILAILGCDPSLFYGGRAALEAASGGILLDADDIAYRCNMVTFEDSDKPFEEKKILSHSAGSIEAEDSDNLIRDLFDSPQFGSAASGAGMEIYPSGSFRHIAVQRNAPSVPLIPLTAPHDHIGEQVGMLLPHGDKTARILAELMYMAHGFLNSHPINLQRRKYGHLPANGIWFWAEGKTLVLPDFECKYGKKGCMISAVPLCRGIGELMGIRQVIVEGATGDLNTNYEGKAEAALESLETCDFAAIHIEAPDECTHDGNLRGKLQAIEWIDSRVVIPLVSKLHKADIDFRMLILSDHKTLISTRTHSSGNVPYILYDSRHIKQQDENSRRRTRGNITFCEKSAAGGRFVPDAAQLMKMLFDENN